MSDPPPKKIGSLRDRIAQFENKGPAPAPAPAPKPKPAGVAHRTWKPRSPSPDAQQQSTTSAPPASGDASAEGATAAAKAGMSAADAREAIGRAGGSLKERMAALQGRGAFGAPAPAPPPKPSGDKPKWKPPPQPAQSPGEEGEPPIKSPPLPLATPSLFAEDANRDLRPGEHATSGNEEEKKVDEEVEGEKDPEEEERQRRAAIAARMARLGGARVGMGPPIMGMKPSVPVKKKTDEEPKSEPMPHEVEQKSQEEEINRQEDAVHTPEVPTEVHPDETVSPKPVPSRQSSLLSPEADVEREIAPPPPAPISETPTPETSPPTQHRAPTSMPVPAGPRRAAPPRKKGARSPMPTPKDEPEEPKVDVKPEEIAEVVGAKAQETAQESAPAEIPPLPPVEDPYPAPTQGEEGANLTIAPPDAHEVVGSLEDGSSKATLVAEVPAPAEDKAEKDEPTHSTEQLEDDLEKDIQAMPVVESEPEPNAEIESPVQFHDEPTDGAPLRTPVHSPPVSSEENEAKDGTAKEADATLEYATEQHETQEPAEHEEQDNEEDEEAARKQRIAEKLAKMGGVNPFAPSGPRSPPLPVRSPSLRQPSGGSISGSPQRKASESSVLSSHVEQGTRVPPPLVRRDTRPIEDEQQEIVRSVSVELDGEDDVGETDSHPLAASTEPEEEFPDDHENEEPQPPPPPKRASAVAVIRDNGALIASPPPTVQHDTAHSPSAFGDGTTPEAPPELEATQEERVAPENQDLSSAEESDIAEDELDVHERAREAEQQLVPVIEEDEEATRKRALAERMAKMGGFNPFGPRSVPPPSVTRPAPPPVSSSGEEEAVDDEVSSVRHRHTSRFIRPTPSALPEAEEPNQAPPPIPLSARPATSSRPSTHEAREEPDERGGVPVPPPIPSSARPADPSHAPVHDSSESEEQEEDVRAASPVTPSAPPVPPARLPLYHDSEASAPDADESEEEDELPPPAPPPRSADMHRVVSNAVPIPVPPPQLSQMAYESDAYEDEEEPPAEEAKVVEPPPPPPRVAHVRHSISRPIPPPPPPEPEPAASGEEADVEDVVPLVPQHDVREHSRAPSGETATGTEQSEPASPVEEYVRGVSTGMDEHLEPEPESPREKEDEILDEEEGDPIDPHFHRPSSQPSSAHPSPGVEKAEHHLVAAHEGTEKQSISPDEEDPEQTRRRTIAERMAKLGGIKFGAPPPIPTGRRAAPAPAPDPENTADVEGARSGQQVENKGEVPEEEEDEQARRARIAAKIAGMGGMRFGIFPGASPVPRPEAAAVKDERDLEEDKPPVPPARPALPTIPTHQVDHDDVKTERKELEDVVPEQGDAEEPPPPPVPSRTARRTSVQMAAPSDEPAPPPPPPRPSSRPPQPHGRPPVPVAAPPSAKTKSSTDSGWPASPRRQSQHAYPPVAPSASEYVIVESEAPPPPPGRPQRAPPSRVAPEHPPLESKESQWELPSIPSLASPSLGFDNESTNEGDLSLAASATWSEDSTTYPSSAAAPLAAKPSLKPLSDIQLSPDELMAVWGKVGVFLHEVSVALHEKSKKTLVGDGSYAGFVNAVLREVPQARGPERDVYGYLIYAQTGPSVQRRTSDILPGDVITLYDAKLKGHKGLGIYHQHVGEGEVCVGVVNEFEAKKSKVRVLQANQHVGHQTVENVSYRLDDLKSGMIKIYRVLEA